MKQVCKILTANIEKIMERDGISALEMDRRVGLTQGRMAAIKRGMVPGVDAVMAIAAYAGVTVDWMVTDHGAKSKKSSKKARRGKK